MRNEIPWGIINLKNGNVKSMFFWGDQLPISDYIGRPFFMGVNDCYSLVRDYYRKELNITLPIWPREYGFWKKGTKEFENVVINGLEEVGFKIVSTDLNDLKTHDGLLGQINSPIINHTAIYIGKGY
jgi:cell wall-associated NlpC family hydrolase